ncbi:MAG: 1-acyl-sn-glycerol-3-phosphate acyltransferase [Tepidisphaeraceae bacterium]|jgi:1-acyl-sn-glycerol-3-phosphate acyltransferase
MFYRIFRLTVAITLRLFFRRIEVDGPRDLPAGPLLLVSNHTNALVDPLIPLIALKRRLTLTGKNVLNKNPLLALLNWGLGTIPFHRREDIGQGADPRQNVQSMRRCREILARGGAVCVFPEGISHSDLKMRPFHVGASRIALDFVHKDGNPGNLQIVPLGLLYTAKGEFRSEACVRIGQPFDAGHWVAAHPEANQEELTQEFRRRIEALTISYENRREMLIVNWANDIVASEAQMPQPLGSTPSRTMESFNRLARLQAGYRTLLADHAADIAALSERVRRYRAELKHRGINPAEVFLPMHPLRAILFLTRELELILIGAPLAFFGIINHLLPYLIVRQVAGRLSSDKDHWATNVVYPSLIIFPLFYAIQLAVAWLLLPVMWAAVYTIALPYTGYYALLYQERVGSAWRRARTFVYFLFRPQTQQWLVAEGQEILAGIQELAGHLEPESAAPPGKERP